MVKLRKMDHPCKKGSRFKNQSHLKNGIPFRKKNITLILLGKMGQTILLFKSDL